MEACRFCGKSRRNVKFLVDARGEVAICEACIADAQRLWLDGESLPEPVPSGSRLSRVRVPLACSFCRQTADSVVQGPGVAVCRDCTQLCADIVRERAG